MKNVLIVSPDINHVTSFYRCMGPFAQLRKQYPGKFAFSYPTHLTWATVAMADVMFMQRPFSPDHLKIFNMAKQHGVPVWIDYDDDLLNVPKSNPAHKVYESISVKTSFLEMLGRADFVTISTPHLIETYKKFTNTEVKVIPNALDDSIFKLPVEKPKTNKIVLWRGSNTHNKDLMTFRMEIKLLADQFPEFAFLFIGKDIDWKFKETLESSPNVRFEDEIDLFSYFKRVQYLKPDLQIVPLWDCSLNRGKSNIAWLESTVAGAVTVGPRFEEWDKPGIATYDNQNEFFSTTKELIEMGCTEGMWRFSRDYIAEHLLLSEVNKLRKEILELL